MLVNLNYAKLPLELRSTDSRGRLSPHGICSTAGPGRAACKVDRLQSGAPDHKIPFRYPLSF